VGEETQRKTGQLRRDVVLVLLLKAVGLYLLWILFFSAPHQVHPTAASTAQQLLGTNSSLTITLPRQVP